MVVDEGSGVVSGFANLLIRIFANLLKLLFVLRKFLFKGDKMGLDDLGYCGLSSVVWVCGRGLVVGNYSAFESDNEFSCVS